MPWVTNSFTPSLAARRQHCVCLCSASLKRWARNATRHLFFWSLWRMEGSRSLIFKNCHQAWYIHTVEYCVAMRGNEGCILHTATQMGLRNRMLSQRWHMRANTAGFHWHEMSRNGRSRETENSWVLAGGWGRQHWGVTAEGSRMFYGVMELFSN